MWHEPKKGAGFLSDLLKSDQNTQQDSDSKSYEEKEHTNPNWSTKGNRVTQFVLNLIRDSDSTT